MCYAFPLHLLLSEWATTQRSSRFMLSNKYMLLRTVEREKRDVCQSRNALAFVENAPIDLKTANIHVACMNHLDLLF